METATIFIDKFDKEVIIDVAHPLYLAQVEKNAAAAAAPKPDPKAKTPVTP